MKVKENIKSIMKKTLIISIITIVLSFLNLSYCSSYTAREYQDLIIENKKLKEENQILKERLERTSISTDRVMVEESEKRNKFIPIKRKIIKPIPVIKKIFQKPNKVLNPRFSM